MNCLFARCDGILEQRDVVIAFPKGEKDAFALWTVNDNGHAEVFAIPFARCREIAYVNHCVCEFFDARHEAISIQSSDINRDCAIVLGIRKLFSRSAP